MAIYSDLLKHWSLEEVTGCTVSYVPLTPLLLCGLWAARKSCQRPKSFGILKACTWEMESKCFLTRLFLIKAISHCWQRRTVSIILKTIFAKISLADVKRRSEKKWKMDTISKWNPCHLEYLFGWNHCVHTQMVEKAGFWSCKVQFKVHLILEV